MSETRSHYGVETIDSIEDVREVFPLGECDELNWFFASTSGVHGSSITIDTLEKHFAPGEPIYLTVLIVHPRLVKMRYGEILIGPENFTYLRGLVRSTLAYVAKSQAGNL